MPTLSFFLDIFVKHMFVEVRAGSQSKITSTTPACSEKTDTSISWIVDALPSGELVVPLPSSEIVTSDNVDITALRLSYETVGPGERAGYASSQALTPPLRYAAPTWPPTGPPVVLNCFQIPAHDLEEWLKTSLTTLRLPPAQRRAMISYWLPMMQVYPFLLVRFLESYEEHDLFVSKLSLLPSPASIRRVFMTWQGIDEQLSDFEKEPHQVQDLEQIATDSVKCFDIPPWPPVEDPNMSDFDKMHDDSYGYVQQGDGVWKYTLLVDASKQPSTVDVVEWGGACLNHLTPDIYAMEMFKVTRV